MGSSAFLQNLAKKQQKKDTDATGRRTDEVRDTLLRTNRKPQAATLSTATAGKPAVPLRSPGTLRSQGQAVDVVRDTGLKKAVGTLREQAKAPKVKINTDRGFTVQNTTVNPRIGWAAADMTKSTAKDEKTRLYETNDSLLNSGEIIKKYQYVAQDQDMDYATLRRAVNKGMSEVGRTLRGTNDNSRFETVAKLQTQLQGRLKSASFTAGLLDAMGGDIRDIVAKASGNEGMQKWNEDWHKQIEETKANHPAAATLGAFTGEAGKAAAGYMTIGKAAEKAALAGAEKLGKRMTAATASDAAQKLAAKVLLDPKKAKAAQFATRMLGQQAADTAVDTPITIAAGLAEGKSKGEIGKDVAKQLAMDAAFNVGLEGVGAAAQAVKNASRRGPIAGIDFEKMGYDNAYVDEELMRFQQDVLNGKVGKKAVFPLTEPSERIVRDIRDLTGIDVSEFKNRIKANAVDHVEKRHGKQGQQDHSMANAEDFAKMEYILNDYDTVILGDKKGGGYRNSDGSPAQKVLFSKRINGTYYVVEAVPDSKEKTLDIVSVFKSNPQKKKAAESFDANRPQVTSKNVSQQLSKNSIPLEGGNVNAEELGNIQKGNRLEQAERNSKKKKGYQGPDVTSPRLNVQNALDLPSTNSIAQEGGNVKETGLRPHELQKMREQNGGVLMLPRASDFKEAAESFDANRTREKTIQGAAEAMVEHRNVLAKPMPKAERQALEQEYAKLSSAEYINGKLKEVFDKTGGNPKAVREEGQRLEGRKQEIAQTLATQEARRTINSILYDVADEVAGIFNLKGKKKKQVANALRRLETEAKEGNISEEARNKLFEQLFAISGESRTGTYGLKKRLSEKKLFLGVDAAADIGDINEWNRQLGGTLGRIKIGRDSNIDAFYRELRRDFPAYFPEGIDREAEQLRQIRKIAEKMQGEIGLEKSDYQENFNRALNRLQDALDVNAAYREKAIAKGEGFRSNLLGKIDYGKVTTAEVEGWYREQYRLQEIADRIPDDLTQTEKTLLEGMLNGDIPEVQAKKLAGPRYSLIRQQYDAQKPLREITERINGHKNFQGAKRYQMAAETVGEMRMADGTQAGWKDKAIGFLYGRETQERNLRDIAPDEETAKRIEEAYFAPIHENERKRTLLINDYKKRLGKLRIGTRKNIPFGLPDSGETRTSESALIQYLGEKRYDLQQMKAAGATAESIAELEGAIRRIEQGLHPAQLEKINVGIDLLRSFYEELHPMINEVLIRNGFDPIGYIPGYFPHMSFDDPTGPFEMAAAKLGFDFSSKELPMDIAGRTENFRPGKRWAGNLLERTGAKTDYDALRAFDLYIDNISDVIYHTDDIRNLRSYEDYIRYSLSDEGIQKEIDAIRQNRSLTPEDKTDKLDKLYNERMRDHRMQNYVNNIRLYTDLLAGKKHNADRILETHLFGRKIYKALNEIENHVAGNMVAANIGSALTNFIPITQGMSLMRMTSNLQGLGEALINMSKGEMDELTRKSTFLATREGTDQLYRTTMRRISDVAGKPMEWADKFTTQAVWRSRYYDNLKNGMAEAEAIRNADDFARGLFGGRSKGATPTLLSAKAFKPLTMFQLEVNNQISYLLKDIPKEAQGSVRKMMQAYGGIVIGAYIYNDVYEKLTGRRSALDPFSIANEAFGDLTGTQVRNTLDILGGLSEGKLQLTEQVEKKKPSQAIAALTEDIGENVPFVGGVLFDGGRIPLQSAIPSPTKIIGAMGNIASGDDSAERGLQTIGQEVQKPFWYMALPAGGGQMRKTLQGLETMAKGGSYNQTNKGPELQFPVDQEKKGQWAKAALFGKWATEGGQQHLEKDRHLGANQTETYQKLVAAGVKNTLAFETIDRIRKKDKDAEKRKEIRQAGMSKEQQAVLYYDLVLKDGSKDREILDYFRKQKNIHKKNVDIGEIYDCLSRMAEHGDKVTPKRNVLKASSLKNEEKKYIYLNKIVDKDDRGKERAKVSALEKYGVKMDDYLRIKNKYAQIDNNGGKPKAKAAEMSQWLSSEGFTSQQQAAIKEQFAFLGMFRQEYK